MGARLRHRAVSALAAGATLSLLGSTAASAHHCYKVDWQERAYENLARSGTAWMAVSDLAIMFMVAPGEDGCAAVVDDAVAAWVTSEGFDQEPPIHSKATIGSGAFYKKGKAPPPITYLSDAQFESLIGEYVLPAMVAAECTLPPEE
ncbi:hypothetical protein ACI3ET_14100 [Ornithinimicrobium sp. LYQ121]|uniref:hypothetical protein n=1 Tax=Ornithinimicrobium sp. LYQ121 TaxID=3378801 RepID=UPI0038552DC9